MSRSHTCATCLHWRKGAPADMSLAVSGDASMQTGACESHPADYVVIDGRLVFFQPETHASRSCTEYHPRNGQPYPDDDPDGDDPDPGESNPDPRASRIRSLFPVQPVAAAA